MPPNLCYIRYKSNLVGQAMYINNKVLKEDSEPYRFTRGFICKTALVQRGWSPKLIAEHLGDPDRISYGKSPFYNKVHLYRAARVKSIEMKEEVSERITDILEQRKTKASRAKEANKVKFEETLSIAKSIPVEVPTIKALKLLEKACRHYNNLPKPLYEGLHRAKPQTCPNRYRAVLMVDYLIDNFLSLESVKNVLYRRIGRKDAENQLAERVCAVIASTYPSLKDEALSRVQ